MNILHTIELLDYYWHFQVLEALRCISTISRTTKNVTVPSLPPNTLHVSDENNYENPIIQKYDLKINVFLKI